MSNKLTNRQRIYVDARLSGMSQMASAAAAGSTGKNAGTEYEKNEVVQAELIARMQKTADAVDFSRKEAHDMLMQAFVNADTAMEQIAAVREMIKLHGIAEPVTIEHKHSHKKVLTFDRMDTKQLIELAEMEDFTLEGEFEVVRERPLLEHTDSDQEEPV